MTEQVEIQLKYEGYITRQLHQIERFKSLEAKKLPADLPYESIQGLRIEAKTEVNGCTTGVHGTGQPYFRCVTG